MKKFAPALLWGTAIFILSTVGGVSPPNIMNNLLESDKLAHAVAYLLFATLLSWGFVRNGTVFWKAVTISVLIGCSYGALLELIQYRFFPNRYFEFWDMVANTVGCFLSILFSYMFIRRKATVKIN